MQKPLFHYKPLIFLLIIVPITFTSPIIDLARFAHLYDTNQQESTETSPFIQALEPYIAGISYYGDWMALEGETLENFKHHSGFARLAFAKLPKSANFTFQELFAMTFYDGIHTDKNYLMLILPAGRPQPAVDWGNSTLSYNNLPAIVLRHNVRFQECPVDLTFSFTNAETNHSFDALSSDPYGVALKIQIVLESLTCGIRLVTSPMSSFDPVVETQIMPYIIFALGTAILNALGYITLHIKMKRSPVSILDISLSTLYFLMTFDIFLGVDHLLTLPHNGRLIVNNMFDIIGVCYIVPAVLLGLSLTVSMKSKIMKLPWSGVINKIFAIAIWFLPFNFLAFITLFGAILSQIRNLYYIFLTVFLLPQIIQNAVLNRKHKWNYWYLAMMFLPKILFMFYTEGYNHNLFRKTPHGISCLAIAVVIGVELTILALQTELPRLWVKVVRPYELVKNGQCSTEECPICLQGFNIEPNPAQAKAISTDEKNTVSQLVITPCKHEFHMKCLKDWILCEPKCPYCRTVLPFTGDFEDNYVHNLV